MAACSSSGGSRGCTGRAGLRRGRRRLGTREDVGPPCPLPGSDGTATSHRYPGTGHRNWGGSALPHGKPRCRPRPATSCTPRPPSPFPCEPRGGRGRGHPPGLASILPAPCRVGRTTWLSRAIVTQHAVPWGDSSCSQVSTGDPHLAQCHPPVPWQGTPGTPPPGSPARVVVKRPSATGSLYTAPWKPYSSSRRT